QYVPGDDVRHIDWKASARTRDPLMKKYEEERELSILLVLDLSRSGSFGTQERTKREILQETAAMLAHAASIAGDKVGIITFAEKIIEVMPPKKGKAPLHRVLAACFADPIGDQGTRLDLALKRAHQMLKHTGVVFVLSDFEAKDYEQPLLQLGHGHDVIAVRAWSAKEEKIPPIGWITLEDPETGKVSRVDTSSYRFQNWQKLKSEKKEKDIRTLFLRSKVEDLSIETEGDVFRRLVVFFSSRSQRR
ncbi:MAG: DUF58 domain-containing protein, partial [Proteobacteria bacterium]